MDKLKEKTVDSKQIYRGQIINLRRDMVMLPDGRRSKREIVEHSGGAAVIPLLDEKVVLVEQFRKPAEEVLLEIPAGMLEAGEEPIECARRELEEETGYRGNKLKEIYTFYTSPGFTSEKIHLYLANKLKKYQPATDENEFINLKKLTIKEVKQKLFEGKIKDAKSIIGLQYLLFEVWGRKEKPPIVSGGGGEYGRIEWK